MVPAKLLRDYHCDGYFWSGMAYVPLWGRDLEILLDCYGEGPTSRQCRILREVLVYPHDLRHSFEKAIFGHYQSEVYGAAEWFDDETDKDVTEERAPKLFSSEQIWGLISEDQLWIHELSHDESAVEFKLSFACTWDIEHGLGVRYSNWIIAEIGGSVLV